MIILGSAPKLSIGFPNSEMRKTAQFSFTLGAGHPGREVGETPTEQKLGGVPMNIKAVSNFCKANGIVCQPHSHAPLGLLQVPRAENAGVEPCRVTSFNLLGVGLYPLGAPASRSSSAGPLTRRFVNLRDDKIGREGHP